jgi:Spy/CpxP family protein refolding chaperone
MRAVETHPHAKESIMKRSHQAAAGLFAALTIGLAAAAFAQADNSAESKGQHGTHGMQQGMQHGMTGGMHMNSEQHAALREKMRSAKTPEDRQKIAKEAHEEMHKQGNDKEHIH